MSKEFIWDDKMVNKFFQFYNDEFHLSKFWEALVTFKASHQPKEDKPEWGIVEMKNKYGERHVGILEVGNDWTHYLNKPMWSINKVKRLSDGEVFTVGDEVEFSVNWRRKITGFDIYDNPSEGKMCRAILGYQSDFDNVYVNIKEIKKSKPKEDKPLSVYYEEELNPPIPKPKEELKEPERIAVTEVKAEGFSDNGNWYAFHIARSPQYGWPTILKEQVPAIKQAIEQVLNDDGKHGIKQWEEKFYWLGTELTPIDKVNKMMEDAATGFAHYLEFIMDEDDWLKDDGDGMKSMPEVYNDFTQWKNSKKSSLK